MKKAKQMMFEFLSLLALLEREKINAMIETGRGNY